MNIACIAVILYELHPGIQFLKDVNDPDSKVRFPASQIFAAKDSGLAISWPASWYDGSSL